MELRTLAALAGVLLLAAVFAVHHFWAGRPRTVAVPAAVRGAVPPAAGSPVPAPAASAPAAKPAGPSAVVVVDVAGKVRKPGVLRLPAGSRVTDALTAAGGPLPGTDTSALNLARLLADGEQVVVGAAPAAAAAPAGAPAAGSGPTAGPVSLSTATEEQLDTLPGVGSVLAHRIIEYRTQHGGFTSVSQLRQVTGVGERRFKDLQPLVRP